MQVQAYLDFNGRCDEALNFYAKAIGAKVETLMRFKDAPPDAGPAGCGTPDAKTADKVMHCGFRVGDSVIMASDGRCEGRTNFQGVSLAITAATEHEADRLFVGLAEGGQVQMPLTRTFFSPKFGMVADRFGVSWMIVVG